jgi:hypothetical protein
VGPGRNVISARELLETFDWKKLVGRTSVSLV